MTRRSSKLLATMVLPWLLTGCISVYTTPQDDPISVPPPPGPETIDPTGPVGEGPEAEALPSGAVTPTEPVDTIKATPENPIPGQLRARYSTSNINIREGPATTYAVLFKAHPNDTVMIINEVQGADGYQWYQVKHSSQGWIREDLLILQEGIATVTADQARSLIHVREGPSQIYRVIHGARVGDRFPVLDQAWDGEGNVWYRLDLTYSGWVREDLITKGTATFN